MKLPTIQDLRKMAKETQRDVAKLDLEVKDDTRILKDDLQELQHARVVCSFCVRCIGTLTWTIEHEPELWDEEIFLLARRLAEAQESVVKLKAALPLLHRGNGGRP